MTKTTALLIANMIALGATPALADLPTCATLGTKTLSAGGNLSVTVDAGDTFTLTGNTLDSILFFEVKPGSQSSSCTGGTCTSFTAAAAGTATFDAFPSSSGSVQITCAAGSGGSGGGGGSSESSVDVQGVGMAAGGTAGASSTAIGGAVGSATGARKGGSSAQAGRSSLFLSTQGASNRDGDGANVWLSIQGTSFTGLLDGDGAELTFGADFEVAPETYLGLLVSYGDYEVTANNIPLASETLVAGPYITTRMGPNVTLDAYLVYGEPEYSSGGTTFTANRVIGGFMMETEMDLSMGRLTGFGGVSGYQEKLPSVVPGGPRTISSTTGSIGGQFDFTPDGAFRPYASFALEANNFDDGAGGNRYIVSPRLGLGFDADVGGGTFGLDLSNGSIFDGARATSGRVSYTLNF